MNEEERIKFDESIVIINDVLEIIKDLSNQDWSIESTKLFCEQNNMKFTEENFEDYIEKITSLDLIEIKNNLLVYQEKLNSLNNEWDNLNENYQKLFLQSLSEFFEKLNTIKKTYNNKVAVFSWSRDIADKLINFNDSIDKNINDLFEQFRYGNKNYVVFGKNGSGKTTLLKKIAVNVFKTNSIVVPANRQVGYKVSDNIILHNKDMNGILSSQESIHYLGYNLCNKSFKQYENEINKIDVESENFKRIFNKLSLDRYIDFNDSKFYLVTEDRKIRYSLTNASDGERSVVYLTLAVLLAPENSFVFIDEPENHLNGALLRNLFDELELSRPDIKFVYFTHNLDFIESRKNIELIHLEKTDKYLEWKFNKIENYCDLSLDIILKIEGMGSKILFCEGDSRNSIDCKILECVYDDFEIIPVGSCEKVIENTKGINGASNIFKRRAYGVIDNDYRSDEEIVSLNEDNIKVLNYNEWENLLLDSDVVEMINKELFNNNIEDIKSSIVEVIKKQKNKIINEYLDKRYIKVIHLNNIKYNENFESNIHEINDKNKKIITKDVNDFIGKFDDYVLNENYYKLVQIVSGKSLIGTLSGALGGNSKELLLDKFITMLKNVDDFKKIVKDKIGITFN